MSATRQVEVVHYRSGRAGAATEARTLVAEGAFTVRVDESADYAIMRTPGHDRELALGFLFSEGIIGGLADVAMLAQCPDEPDALAVRTARAEASPARRNLVVQSSCGLCGRVDIDALVASLPVVGGALRINVSTLYAVPEAVRRAQDLFAQTGGTHAAALFDARGRLVVVREDVGRHNAMDKVVGHALLTGTPMDALGVFLSGRASLEMVIKAARAGLAVVAAVSAPTAAAVEAAGRLGITLCGFVRGSEVTVYTHPERLEGG